MSNIKRYDFLIMANNDTRMAQTNIGDYVLFSDHEQRVKELERWCKPLERRVLEANEEVEDLEADNKAIKLENGKLWLENDDLQAKLDRARKALVRLQVRIVESREPSKEDIEASRIIINETLAELKGEL